MAEQYMSFEDPYMSGFGLVAVMAAMAAPYHAAERRNNGITGVPPRNPKKVIPNGCKEFMIEGERIIALSYDRAVKKYQKLKKSMVKVEEEIDVDNFYNPYYADPNEA